MNDRARHSFAQSTGPIELPIRIHHPRASCDYSVIIGAGVLRDAGPRIRRAACAADRERCSRAFVVADPNVPRPHLDVLLASLAGAGFGTSVLSTPAGEPAKSFAVLEQLHRALAATRHERGDVVVSLGGGVVGDLAGFAAATYRRGCPVVHCPTTLLSMVDASVGGKTGINLSTGVDQAVKKNMIGSFHQPILVLADVAALGSLPLREFRAGLAECLKHALLASGLGDPTLLRDLEADAATLAPGANGLPAFIARNIAIKAGVVESDPFEQASDAAGGRALLNLGHTFGHAIEPLTSVALYDSRGDRYGSAPVLHGEAVAIGLQAAVATSRHLDLVSDALASRVRTIVTALELPVRFSGPSAADLLDAMRDDKKVLAGKIRLILPYTDESGAVFARVEAPGDEAIMAGWRAVLA